MNSNDLAPVIIMGLGILAIIVRMLLVHQQRMTELVHKLAPRGTAEAENARLHQEVTELKQLVMQQSIALDNLSDRIGQPASEPVQKRLTGVQ